MRWTISTDWESEEKEQELQDVVPSNEPKFQRNRFSAEFISTYQEPEKPSPVAFSSNPVKNSSCIDLHTNYYIQSTKWTQYPTERDECSNQESFFHPTLYEMTIGRNHQHVESNSLSGRRVHPKSDSKICIPKPSPIAFESPSLRCLDQLSALSSIITDIEYSELAHRRDMWLSSSSSLSSRGETVEEMYGNYLREKDDMLMKYARENRLFDEGLSVFSSDSVKSFANKSVPDSNNPSLDIAKLVQPDSSNPSLDSAKLVQPDSNNPSLDIAKSAQPPNPTFPSSNSTKSTQPPNPTFPSSDSTKPTQPPNPTFPSAKPTQSNQHTQSKNPVSIAVEHNKTKEEAKKNQLVAELSQTPNKPLPTKELLVMYQELFLLLNSSQVSNATREVLKQECRHFMGLLNTVSMNQQQILTCCSSVLERLATITNENCQIYMIYYITANLIQKGKESRDYSVCLSYAYLLHELASRDARFVVMSVAGLLYECPFLIPELPKKPRVMDAKQFDEEVTFMSRITAMFAGLFLYIPTNNKKVFPLHWAWEWLEKVMEQQEKYKSLEFASVVGIFLQILNLKLKMDDETKMEKMIENLSNMLTALEKIPEKTVGSILRLEDLLKRLQAGEFKIPEFCDMK